MSYPTKEEIFVNLFVPVLCRIYRKEKHIFAVGTSAENTAANYVETTSIERKGGL